MGGDSEHLPGFEVHDSKDLDILVSDGGDEVRLSDLELAEASFS